MSTDDRLFERFGAQYPVGHVLFKDGEPGKEMYVIQAGKVRISKHVRGIETTLGDLGPGEFFGEMSILNNKPRSATATVLEPAKLLVIDPKTFEAMVRGNAEIAVRIIKKLAQRLEAADHQIENLLHKDHHSRVVHALAHLAKTEGKPHADGVFVALGVNDLPGKIGLDPAPVNEVVSRLVKASLVSVVDGGMVVKDVNKLREFLEFLEMKEKFGDL